MAQALYRVHSWAADAPAGTATTRVVLDGEVDRDMFEPVAEFTFKALIGGMPPALPDDWAAFATEWLQRGTWIECQVTDDGSFHEHFTFTVVPPGVWPAVGETYDILGQVYTILSCDTVNNIIETTRGTIYDDPDWGSAWMLKSSGGAGDVAINFTSWLPHTRAIFYGTIWEISAPRQAGEQIEVTVKCLDPLVAARGNGLNLSRATKMLLYECEWDATDAAWHAGTEVDFLVDIPDNGVDPEYGYEFVPHGIVHLETYRTSDFGDNKYTDHYEYAPGDYSYSASAKQIYFTASENTRKTEHVAVPGATERIWKLKLYVYDPTDLSNSVKAVLTDVLAGRPWSHGGGCGFDPAQLDLAEIYGFDAGGITQDQWGFYYTTGTVKCIRKILREKTEGPIVQFFDDLREQGLLPQDYWLRYDPQLRQVVGRYMLQDSGGIYTPAGTISNDQPISLEGIAGRCECWSKSGSLEDFARRSTITVNVPVVDDPASAQHGVAYHEHSTDALGTAALTDGKSDTMYSFYLAISHEPMFIAQRTPDDAIVLELLDDTGAGCIKDIRRIQLTGGIPINDDGVSFAPKDGPSKLYLVMRSAKATISASETLIDAANPGIPIATGGISAELDPLNVGVSNGLDIDVECENIWRARYIAIRWEQDNYIRGTADDVFGDVIRISYFILSSVKILGDGRLHYRTGYDKGQVPYAQISKQHGVVTNVAAFQVTMTTAHAASFTVGDPCRFYDTPGAAPFVMDANLITNIGADIGGFTILTFADALPVGLGNTDIVGHFSRWRLDASGVWVDFCYPKLYQKLRNSSNWLEIVEDDSAADESEAEALAVERLLTMIHVARDHSVALPLDFSARAGRTIRCYNSDVEWLATHEHFRMTPSDGTAPWVTQSCDGTDYEEVPQ